MKNTIFKNEALQRMTLTAMLEEVSGKMTVSCPNLSRIAAVGLLIPASTAGKKTYLEDFLFQIYILQQNLPELKRF